MAFVESFGGQALLSGISTAMNWLQQGHSISAQKDAQKELMDHQFELNQRQWAAENEYNSPGAQMQRLKSAGLNPNLVYGSGSVTGNTTTQGPRAQYTRVDRNQAKFENLANIAERVQQIKSMRANVSAQEKLAELYGQQAANAGIQGELMNMEKTKRGFENMLLEQTMPYSIEGAMLRNEEIRRNNDYILKKMGYTDAQIDQIRAGILKLNAETGNIKERTKTQQYQNQFWWQYGQNPSGSIGKSIFDFLSALVKSKFGSDEPRPWTSSDHSRFKAGLKNVMSNYAPDSLYNKVMEHYDWSDPSAFDRFLEFFFKRHIKR